MNVGKDNEAHSGDQKINGGAKNEKHNSSNKQPTVVAEVPVELPMEKELRRQEELPQVPDESEASDALPLLPTKNLPA